MNQRVIADPSQHGWVEVDGKWKWAAGSGGGGGYYDDTEVRGLIADNTANIATNVSDISINSSAISSNSGRIDALEAGGGGGDSFWEEESPGVIKYTGTVKAADVVATG
mgnify:CR=1 FL=1